LDVKSAISPESGIIELCARQSSTGDRQIMVRKYFGTDGIRGMANGDKLTPELALRVGMAAGTKFVRGNHRNRVVIGKDTRRSGYMLEQALTAGFTAVGMDVYLLGPMPTPAVAMLTRSLRADLGVMISASHNPYEDNGIKLFRPDGYKLSDTVEKEIERLIDGDMTEFLAHGRDIGRAHRDEEARTRYIEYAKRTLPRNADLAGLRVVLDCANGAAYKVAPLALWELGAEVFTIGDKPDGFNINDKVGSTAPDAVAAKVKEVRADIGIALDGDADRVIIVDEKGNVIDGDQFMAVIAQSWLEREMLVGGGIVATIMSNLGLERYLASLGLSLERTQVGDRYVLEAMRTKGFNVGGEQSGHIILSDFTTTGDGLVAALQLLSVLKQAGKPVSEICSRFEKVPQLLRNVKFKSGKPLENQRVIQAISDAEAMLGASGRLVVRPSGTEPVIRVMGEADDAALVNTVVSQVESAILEVA
jgi:phosphoglucosamine mutase